MSPLDTQLEAVLAMIKAQGGVAGIDPGAPDYVKRAFLEMILSCPDCIGKNGGHYEKGN